MQEIWKKAGAAIGSALMMGTTLVGAAIASDLGDYKDLIVASDGAVTGLYVVGSNAATADVVTAMGMTAWVGNQQVEGTDAGSGQITLTPLETTVKGVRRHVEFDNLANASYEFGASTAGTYDIIGPEGFASGDGVVDFLYSHNEKGPIYINGTEYNWHEEVNVSLTVINATRDITDSQAGDQYDEILLTVDANSMAYRWESDSGYVSATDMKGKKLWFMGKEYTLISMTSSIIKLGATDSEVVLTTANPTTTVGGVDVTLGGIYSSGTSGAYKAKVTVTNGGTTETKYIDSTETDTVAGIEIYVKNAVVTTIGTNEGEAQMVVGAGVLKLTDGDYLTKGDGTETSWLVTKTPSSNATLLRMVVTESQTHSASTGDYPILRAGDVIDTPNGLFALQYNGLADQYGTAVRYRTINIQPESRNIGRGSTTEKTIRIRTPDSAYVQFVDNASGATKLKKEVWVAVNETAIALQEGAWYWKDTSGTTTVYKALKSPRIKLTAAKTMPMTWTFNASGIDNTSGTFQGAFSISEPTLSQDTSETGNITIEYNNSKFQDSQIIKDGYYAYAASFANATPATGAWFGRSSNYTTSTRDYYTKFGTYVSSVGQYLVTLKAPEGQTYAEFIFGTQAAGTGAAQTVSAGESVTIGGTTIQVEGAVSGNVPITLPATIAKTDADVTSSDKAGYTLVLVGGPAVNTLVNELQTAGKLEKTIGSPGSTADVASAGAGVVELVEDAWGTGKYAIVVAGSDRAGTSAAGNVLASFDSYASMVDGKTAYVV